MIAAAEVQQVRDVGTRLACDNRNRFTGLQHRAGHIAVVTHGHRRIHITLVQVDREGLASRMVRRAMRMIDLNGSSVVGSGDNVLRGELLADADNGAIGGDDIFATQHIGGECQDAIRREGCTVHTIHHDRSTGFHMNRFTWEGAVRRHRWGIGAHYRLCVARQQVHRLDSVGDRIEYRLDAVGIYLHLCAHGGGDIKANIIGGRAWHIPVSRERHPEIAAGVGGPVWYGKIFGITGHTLRPDFADAHYK